MSARTLTRSKRSRKPVKRQLAAQHSQAQQPTNQHLQKQLAQSSLSYSLQNSFLIIGYGNKLHGDDAVGSQVADRVDSWHVPQVRAIAVHQLTPKLATTIANSDYVIFVDACDHRSCTLHVQVEPLSIRPAKSDSEPNSAIAHSHSAQGLLALTNKLYGYAPQAWLIQVPVESFGLGDPLSSTAQHGVDEAVQTIERFLVNYQVPCSPAS